MKKLIPLFCLVLFPLTSGLFAGTGGGKDVDVKVIHAEGKIFYHEIFVTWSTEYENANFDYLIEASEDGEDWRIRGRVKSKGSANALTEYKFVDKKEKFNFYRIRKMKPQGGSSVLSKFELENYSIAVSLDALDFADSKSLVMGILRGQGPGTYDPDL